MNKATRNIHCRNGDLSVCNYFIKYGSCDSGCYHLKEIKEFKEIGVGAVCDSGLFSRLYEITKERGGK